MSRVQPIRLSRRTFLRGSGVALALPYLEAMMPSSVLAAPKPQVTPRMGTFYFGTGMNMREFEPEETGPNFKLSRILKPLDPVRGHFTVLSNTWLNHGGGHDGAYPFATSIARGEKQSISPDQLAAQQLGQDTRFPSLQLSIKRGTGFGDQALATISWNEQGVPLAAENDPHVIFAKLFRPDSQAELAEKDHAYRRRGSILDIVRDDAKRMQQKLGQSDRQQLEQYFNSIREVEAQLQRNMSWMQKTKPEPEAKGLRDYTKPVKPDEGGNGFVYNDYARMMYDLIALAFQTDSTRVVSYVVRTELAGGVYPEFGVSKGYHALTHHGNDPKNLEELAKVDTIYMQHWAYFLQRLQAVKEGEGTLLDHTVLGFSSGMGIGHSKDHLPTVISGGSGLGIAHQGHLKLAEPTPLSSVWHTMLDRMGVAVPERFQDSKGVIQPLVKV